MMKLAVLGPKGTFSDNASDLYIKETGDKMERVYFSTIDEAFHSVGKTCDIGIIPIENTLDGYVQRTIDLLSEEDVHIKEEITIPVQFSLLANAQDKDSIKRLYVQFKANGQCRHFLDSLGGVSVVTTESNMESFYKLESGIEGDAAIVPAHVAGNLSARFKLENITDSISNFTRFVVIVPGRPCEEIADGMDFKAPVYISPETDRPGMLFDMLSGFQKNDLNLVSIISRPTKKEMGTYNFFMEIKSHSSKKDVLLKVLDELGAYYGIKLMGMYSVK
ncbi:MAG: prephenate dehydratase [Lachnospiraceae bacterium]|nr:prephenate dehydratase [Lachnospiraceae bacterium]